MLPVSLHITPEFGVVGFGTADAVAQGRGNGNGNGNSGNERSASADRDVDRGNGQNDRDRGNGRSERENRGDRAGPNGGNGGNGRANTGASVRGPAAAPGNSGTAPAMYRSATASASVPGFDNGPGHAPTEAGTARTRAMVEIAKELGAVAPEPPKNPLISGPVTQQMLDSAEQAYIGAVRDAWEAHGFPWTDSDVLRTLGELEALVSVLEGIMENSAGHQGGRALARVAPDVNDDGFVDINDLWDAHLR